MTLKSNYVDKIEFIKYKRFENQTIQFKEGVNAIAGTNGTCKSSLLHIISNSFQDCNIECLNENDKNCIKIIRSLLISTNPKIESLNRKDLNKNDPAPGIKGPYYTVTYNDNSTTSFRKHNSKNENEKIRYRVIPGYKRGSGEKLKQAMVAYLGINRLFPFGEFSNDKEIEKINKTLPTKYKEEIVKLFNNLTSYSININSIFAQKMGLIKKRINFLTDKDGVDSNTISAGEDNLLILITTLVCLKYFRESLKNEFDTPAILLVDELDATLHPEFQIKIVKLFSEYANAFNIQFFFTTHSITLLNYMIEKKLNIIYILDNVNNIKIIEDISADKIENFLENSTEKAKYKAKKIPIYTEDAEARLFLTQLLENSTIQNFDKVCSYLHIVNGNFGCDTLKQLFLKDEITKYSIKAIGILDGDQKLEEDDFKLMKLPGDTNPEILIFKYILDLYERTDDFANTFWETANNDNSFTKHFFRNNVKNSLEELISQHDNNQNNRSKNKVEFNKHVGTYRLAFITWCNDSKNKTEIELFFNSLKKIFLSLHYYFNIKSDVWN